MLVLLAPSEAKADAPAGAPPLDVGALGYASLTPARERVLRAVHGVANQRSARRALAALGLSPGQAAELERDKDLRAAPAAPAADVYTGVLYRHLDLAGMDPATRRRAAERLLVASALFGVVGLDDAIPAYRLSIGASLPRLGRLAAFWRPHLTRVLPPAGLVVDLRSQGYASAWRPAGAELLAIGVRTPEGRVVSHMAKATRGAVAALLAAEPAMPRTAQDVAEIVAGAGHDVHLAPGTLTVIA